MISNPFELPPAQQPCAKASELQCSMSTKVFHLMFSLWRRISRSNSCVLVFIPFLSRTLHVRQEHHICTLRNLARTHNDKCVKPDKKMKISIQWNENGKKYFSVLVALASVFFSFCDKTNNWLRRDCDLWHNRQSTGEFGRVRSMCVGSNCEKFFLFSFFLVAEHVTQALTCWC